jgi:hypothetical protein
VIDTITLALMADVDLYDSLVRKQLRADPDNEVALAMYGADLKRAKKALDTYLGVQESGKPAPRRLDRKGAVSGIYIDGRRAA